MVTRTVDQMLVWLGSVAFLRTVDVRLSLVEDSPVLRTRGVIFRIQNMFDLEFVHFAHIKRGQS